MVLPFSNWQLQLPDYFLLGYAARVLLWLAYTAVMSKASTVVDEVAWLMFKPVKGGRPGEYEEVGQVKEKSGQVPFGGEVAGGGGDGEDDDDGSGSSSDDDEDDDGSGEDVDKKSTAKQSKQSKQKQKQKRTSSKRSHNTTRATKQPTTRNTTTNHNDDSKATVLAERDGVAAGGGGQSAVDVRGSETVKARVNGETVILIKKPKAAVAAGTSSGSGSGSAGSGVGSVVSEGMHALDIHDDGGEDKSINKKGR